MKRKTPNISCCGVPSTKKRERKFWNGNNEQHEVIGKLLFTTRNINEIKQQIHNIWRKREKRLKEGNE